MVGVLLLPLTQSKPSQRGRKGVGRDYEVGRDYGRDYGGDEWETGSPRLVAQIIEVEQWVSSHHTSQSQPR